MPIHLSASLVPGPLTAPLLDGDVVPEGINWTLSAERSVDRNSRHMLALGFDVGEMSLATFLKAREQGVPFLGLPIFTGRRFLQPCVLCDQAAGITELGDLAGKKVGLPQFWMTSSVWHRGILQQHGVNQREITWYTAGDERLPGLGPPPGVEVQCVQGQPIQELLLTGQIDAVLLPRPVDALAAEREGLTRPFGDVVRAQRDYFAATGVFPIMHFVVLREELAHAYPWLPERLCHAFQKAREWAVQTGHGPDQPIVGLPDELSRALFPTDPWTYGLAPNRRALEMFLEFATTQGLLAQAPKLESLFVPSVDHLFRQKMGTDGA